MLDHSSVHVDETGWRTRGEGRALWTTTTAEAAFFQIAEHCNRAQFNALIGPYPGIVVSDRWNGYSHLDPNQRQVCWSHLQRDFRRHADGLGEQKAFGEQGVPLTNQRPATVAAVTSNAATDWIDPVSKATKASRSGPDGRSWPTTLTRSPSEPGETLPRARIDPSNHSPRTAVADHRRGRFVPITTPPSYSSASSDNAGLVSAKSTGARVWRFP